MQLARSLPTARASGDGATGGRPVTALEHDAPGAAWADTYARRGNLVGPPR